MASRGLTTDRTSLAAQITNKEFYQEAGYTTATREANWRKKNHAVGEIEAGVPSSTVTSIAASKTYLAYMLPHLATIIGFYGQRVHRRSRFDRYMGKHVAQEKLAAKFIAQTGAPASKLAVAFGAARFNQNSAGSAMSPRAVGWLQRILHREGAVVAPDVDEFMTSQTCPCCQGRVLKRERSRRSHFQVKSCKNSLCLAKVWNRDVMAATNIRDVFLYQVRAQSTEKQHRPHALRYRADQRAPVVPMEVD